MHRKTDGAFSREAAKSIKSAFDLDDFRKMITKITVETVLNAELGAYLDDQKNAAKTQSNRKRLPCIDKRF